MHFLHFAFLGWAGGQWIRGVRIVFYKLTYINIYSITYILWRKRRRKCKMQKMQNRKSGVKVKNNGIKFILGFSCTHIKPAVTLPSKSVTDGQKKPRQAKSLVLRGFLQGCSKASPRPLQGCSKF